MPALVAPTFQQHHTTLAVLGAFDAVECRYFSCAPCAEHDSRQWDGVPPKLFEEVCDSHGHIRCLHSRIDSQFLFFGLLLHFKSLFLLLLCVGQFLLAQCDIVGITLVSQLYLTVQSLLSRRHLIISQLLGLVGSRLPCIHPTVQRCLGLVKHAVECRNLVAGKILTEQHIHNVAVVAGIASLGVVLTLAVFLLQPLNLFLQYGKFLLTQLQVLCMDYLPILRGNLLLHIELSPLNRVVLIQLKPTLLRILMCLKSFLLLFEQFVAILLPQVKHFIQVGFLGNLLHVVVVVLDALTLHTLAFDNIVGLVVLVFKFVLLRLPLVIIEVAGGMVFVELVEDVVVFGDEDFCLVHILGKRLIFISPAFLQILQFLGVGSIGNGHLLVVPHLYLGQCIVAFVLHGLCLCHQHIGLRRAIE